MGSGLSRQETVESRWWEEKALDMLTNTSDTGKVGLVCSFIPISDESAMIGVLKERSDLETLVAIHCKSRERSKEQSVTSPTLTDEAFATELWRVLRFSSGYQAPWDWDWRPSLFGNPWEIADEFHTVVTRAVFRIPTLDFVRYALGYEDKAPFIRSLFSAVRDVCSNLRSRFNELPEMKNTYVKVEQILRSRYRPLAHWIVANSLGDSDELPYPPVSLIDFALNPIKDVFATRSLSFVLGQLAVLDQRLRHVNRAYDWTRWSTDLGFLEVVYQALRPENLTNLPATRLLPPEDRDARMLFLGGFEMAARHEIRALLRKMKFSFERLHRMGLRGVRTQ
ncbi:hypothetical protein BKA61DRAFT_662440 [Leptodontidium sp. MPI-SDFR-AT-0119]|nr:hypothetical protein BKA61DRAFT_662440 [Leptodontidium sp. MPI-SDFR-AT-0119]